MAFMSKTTNQEIAQTFKEMADLLAIKGDNPHRVRAYRRAAESIADLDHRVERMWERGMLKDVPGIGDAISAKIEEIVTTGRLAFLEKLRAEVPPTLLEVTCIPGVGPKKARELWQKLGLTTLSDVEEAAREGRLRGLPGWGEKSEKAILDGIEKMAHAPARRFPIGEAWGPNMEIIRRLALLNEVERVTFVGSLRRYRDTIADLDLLVATRGPTTQITPIVEAFEGLDEVARIDERSGNAVRGVLRNGVPVEMIFVDASRWGTALQQATGSKAHNARLAEIARGMGCELRADGLFRADGSAIPCGEEDEVYAALGLPYITPELREDAGEIEAALEGRLPDLIEYADVLGDLHCHTTWSDGRGSVADMAVAAINHGNHYLAITDHTPGNPVANGVSVEELRAQWEEIDEVQKHFKKFRLLKGAEVEILPDGSLDYPDEVLRQLDVVVASVHTKLRQDKETMTRRIIRAMRNPHVHIIGHPTGRFFGQHPGDNVDVEAILRIAAETGKIVEVNCGPMRLDLSDRYVRRAVELGVKLAINTDAHHPERFETARFGVAIARRGWAGKRDVVNCMPLSELLPFLKGSG